jgi:pimeloyl-ACP methyl ester carboxylesterase
MRSLAMYLAGAVVAPLATAAAALLPPPMSRAHAIAAPRRVLWSSSLGRISYYEDGGASGLPVLLLHDVARASSAFELCALFEQLRGDRPLVVPDLLGHGFSEHRKTPFTREEHVQFVQEIIVDLSRRYGATVDVLAVGTTSELAAAAIVRSSRHVRSLVMIAPTGFRPVPWVVRTASALVARGVLGRLVRTRSGLYSLLLRAPNVVAGVYDALRVPTCILHGGDDDVPRAEIEFLGDGHASFQRSEIRGAHAAPHVERADATADALRAFWRTLAVKPELRVIRGARTERGALSARPRPAAGKRRRSWT